MMLALSCILIPVTLWCASVALTKYQCTNMKQHQPLPRWQRGGEAIVRKILPMNSANGTLGSELPLRGLHISLLQERL